MNAEELKVLPKTEIPALAKNLKPADVQFLVQTLSEKDDTLRYNAFLLLQANSRLSPLVYAHWDILAGKLANDNSYQRSLGVMLIAENVRWDKDGKFKETFSKYMQCCSDEKFVTTRQTIQGLAAVLEATAEFDAAIRQSLGTLDVSKYKENQQKLLNKDILGIMQVLKNRK